jgi:RNA polymerase sigma-70 factor, ECF subfamily
MDILGLLLASLVDENELDLARRLKSKDPQALADAYDLYGRIAFVLIVRIVRNAAIAEDLVQETFLRVWNRVDQIGEKYGVIGPWLLAIARNSALDYVKSGAARFMNPKPISDADVPPVTIDHQIQLSERVRHLNQACETLPPNQRQVIELAYYEGLSQQEIAERLSEPLGTIKGRMRLALQRLRAAIDIEPVQPTQLQ